MGEVYAWASPTYILREMTLPMLRMYLERIPDREYERQIMTAQLLSLVASIGREKNGKALAPKDFLVGYAREAHKESKRYPPEVAAALRWAASFKVLPQAAIDLVDWDET